MYYGLVILSVLSSAVAQMLLKQGTKGQDASLLRQYLNIWVVSGYTILGAALLLNIFCISHGVQVKEIGGIESLSYLFVPCLSWLFFKERVTRRKMVAILIIMIGVGVFFV